MSEKIQSINILARWLKKYNWKIYFNQKNPDDFPKFHANTTAKPDILITKKDTRILIEVKAGDKHKQILDGYQQTLEYAGEYYIGGTQYRIESEKNIKIDAFVLATKFSKSGYLYNDEQETDYLGHTYLKKEHNLVEKPSTHSIIRLLWRQWEKGIPTDYYNEKKGDNGKKSPSKKPKIGALLSRINRDKKVSSEPHLFLNSNIFTNLTRHPINI